MKLNFQEVTNWRLNLNNGRMEDLLNKGSLILWGDNTYTFGNLGVIHSLSEEQGNLIAKMVDGNIYLLTKKNIQKSQRNSFASWVRKIKVWE